MMLNAYGSAILKSEMDFPIWASVKYNIKNPVKRGFDSEPEDETKVYDKLIAEGYTVKVSPLPSLLVIKRVKRCIIILKELEVQRRKKNTK